MKMTNAEMMAALKNTLDEIAVNERLGAFKAFRTGISNPRSTNLPSGKNLPQRAGAAIARNPGKVAAGSAALGVAGTAAVMGSGSKTEPGSSANPPTASAPVRPAAAAPTPTAPAAAEPAAPAAAPEAPAGSSELDELDALAREFGQSQEPLAIELMGQYNALRSKLGKAKEVPGELEEMIRLLKY